MQLQGSLGENVEGGLQLEAVLEEIDSGKDIEAESGTRHGHDQTSNISQVTHVEGADQGEENVVVLLTLKFVHRRDLVRNSDHLVVPASVEEMRRLKNCCTAIFRKLFRFKQKKEKKNSVCGCFLKTETI